MGKFPVGGSSPLGCIFVADACVTPEALARRDGCAFAPRAISWSRGSRWRPPTVQTIYGLAIDSNMEDGVLRRDLLKLRQRGSLIDGYVCSGTGRHLQVAPEDGSTSPSIDFL